MSKSAAEQDRFRRTWHGKVFKSCLVVSGSDRFVLGIERISKLDNGQVQVELKGLMKEENGVEDYQPDFAFKYECGDVENPKRWKHPFRFNEPPLADQAFLIPE
jgi:hypothetical protein